jgi:hypothetical protein
VPVTGASPSSFSTTASVWRYFARVIGQARPHALEGRRCRPAVLRLGQRAAAATPDRRPPRRSGVPIQPSPEPARAPAAGDICPLTGRERLSYRRAAELLVAQTGWTLHQFRHSALTHLAEDNVQLPLLMRGVLDTIGALIERAETRA